MTRSGVYINEFHRLKPRVFCNGSNPMDAIPNTATDIESEIDLSFLNGEEYDSDWCNPYCLIGNGFLYDDRVCSFCDTKNK